MVGVVVLLYLDLIVLKSLRDLRAYFKPQDSSFVVVYITVVRSAEYRNDGWEFSWPVPLMQLIAVHLDLVSANHAKKVVVF